VTVPLEDASAGLGKAGGVVAADDVGAALAVPVASAVVVAVGAEGVATAPALDAAGAPGTASVLGVMRDGATTTLTAELTAGFARGGGT
jgi:hypothetical protein